VNEEIVARKGNCGITLSRRVVVLPQVSTLMWTALWGEVKSCEEDAVNGSAAQRHAEPAKSSEQIVGGRVNQTAFQER
jgi:hypothetical protein